jgi:hypothetical protein
MRRYFGRISCGLVASILLATICFLFTVRGAAAGVSVPGAIVTYTLVGGEGIHENVPATFGAIFAKGDVPPGTSVIAEDSAGHVLPSQVDLKAKHLDGSLRHAVITVVVPRLTQGQEFSVALVRGGEAPAHPLSVADLPSNFDAKIDLLMNGLRYVASARDLLIHSKPQLWLSGHQVTEWWVSGPLRDPDGRADPHLAARFGIRSYGKDRPVRVEVDVENTWTLVPGRRTEFYDAQILLGGKVVFEKPGIIQDAQTRWRKVFWWDVPSDVYVKQDVNYLKKARVIPNYDYSSASLLDIVGREYREFQRSDHNPMSSGIITGYMPMTGGRKDIGPLPGWSVIYLLSMDKRAYEMTLSAGDLAGSFGAHYRNEKTGAPSTAEEFPKLSTHSNYVGKPGNLPIPITDGHKSKLVPQRAHEPSLAFIPYLVTGDRYYLEELQFWSQWNSWGTAPENRQFKDGLISWDEVRGQAWSFRTLAQAAYITPEADPLKQPLLREISANIKYYNQHFLNNPQASVLHEILTPSRKAYEYSSWMDDYFTWSISYAVQLGFEIARPFAVWKAEYPVQRMINPQYCWIMATPYRLIGQKPDGTFVKSWADAYKYTFQFAAHTMPPDGLKCGGDEMQSLLRLRPGEMMGGAENPGGYPSNLQPALAAAVDLGVKGAQEAWEKFQARPVKPHAGVSAQWSIVPWGNN